MTDIGELPSPPELGAESVARMTGAAPSSGSARRGHPARWAAVAVGLVVAVLVGLLATRPPASDVVAPSPIVGQLAPPVEGPGLDGQVVRLADLRGRWVVVNFFATWCVPCLKEHPELVKFSDRHPPEDAQVLGVVYDDDRAEVQAFFAKRGGGWPVVDDSAAKVGFGVRGVPESFLVDPDGVVLTRIVGGLTANGLDRLLTRAKALR